MFSCLLDSNKKLKNTAEEPANNFIFVLKKKTFIIDSTLSTKKIQSIH